MLKNERKVSIILSSPSGAGKTTLAKKIKENFSSFEISISHTTRTKRPGEKNGIDYFFITKKEFLEKIEKKEFYEHANIFGNLYGSSKNTVKNIQEQDKFIVFDIDWQGARQLTKNKDLNLIKIFILPPSKSELIKRLNLRKKDKEKSIKERISFYEKDITHWKEYDYIFLNNDLDVCFSQIRKLLNSII